jgi:A/G-specific adenine glycosylase
VENFGESLISWYDRNKRDLPWRNSKDPYKIWLSEIILQQTRVDQGLGYYLRFVDKYPDVFKLAAAPEEEVFKLWQGLGYYNRATNMLLAARTIVKKHKGIFPDNRNDLLKLKGIGTYTSAAIASMVFEEPVAVVDGNVYRVLSRVFGIKTPINTAAAKVEFDAIASELLKDQPPGTFNQAMMEFGALFCKPRNPDCEHCIFQSRCFAFSTDMVHQLPVKKAKMVVVERYFYYLVVELKDTGSFYMNKRESKDIWKNLYDFPLEERTEKTDPLDVLTHTPFLNSTMNQHLKIKSVSHEYRHLLSHQRIHAQFIRLVVDKKLKSSIDKSLLLITKKEIINYPVPRLIERYLEEQKII